MEHIFGNTFPVRDQLKKLGGRWNPARRCWDVADDRADEARRVVAEGPTAQVQAPANSITPVTASVRHEPPPRPPEPPPEPVYVPPSPCHACGWQKWGPNCSHCQFTTENLS